MDNSQFLILLIALTATVMITLVIVGVLSYQWRKKTAQALDSIRERLRVVDSGLSQMDLVRRNYSEPPLPQYKLMTDELNQRTLAAAQAAREVDYRVRELEAQLGPNPANPLLTALQILPNSYRGKRISGSLQQTLADVEHDLDLARKQSERVTGFPSQVSAAARQIGQEIDEAGHLYQYLERASVKGQGMNEAHLQQLFLENGVERIPVEFASEEIPDGTQPDVRALACQVDEVLKDLRPSLETWLPRLRTWQKQHQNASDSYKHLQKLTLQFRRILEEAPTTLDTTAFRNNLLKVSGGMIDLKNSLSSPDIDDLKKLERESSQMERVIEEDAAQYDQAVRQCADLDQALLELEAGFNSLNRRLVESEQHPDLPLEWDQTRPVMEAMMIQYRALGPRDSRRAPEQVNNALVEAKNLRQQLQGLSGQIDQLCGQQKELAALLDSTELQQGHEWLARARQTSAQASAYHPANWSTQHDLPGLLRDLKTLSVLHESLTPAEEGETQPESELSERLKQTHELAALHQKLRGRVDQVRTRLDKLRQEEQSAHDEMDRVSATLERTALLVKDNTLLQPAAAVQIDRLRQQIEKLLDDLDHPEQGALERKTSRSQALSGELTVLFNQWVQQLTGDSAAQAQKISQALVGLEPVATLDDRMISDARNQRDRQGRSAPAQNAATYMQAAAALKIANDEWQSCATTAAALEKAAAPILSAYHDADDARRSLQTALQQAGSLAGGKRSWPACRQALTAESAHFQQLEARLNGLHGQHWTASQLVLELERIYHELDKLQGQIDQAVKYSENERKQVRNLEQEINRLSQRWQSEATTYPTEIALQGSVRDLIFQANARVNSLKNQYLRGSASYDQVLSGLETIQDGLLDAAFTTEDGREILLVK